jgi:hypothetical protein
MRIGLLLVTVGGLGVLGAAPASANGRFPASNQITFSPSDPNLIVLRATFGILVSHDRGSTWRWLCEDALGVASSAVEDPSVGLTATNALVAGLRGGLDVSSDTGCNWAYVGGKLHQEAIFDVVVRRDNADTVLAGASTFEPDAGEAGAPALYDNQIFESTDDGADWSPLGAPFDPSLTVTTFEVGASDPKRLYAAGFNQSMTSRSFWILESADNGAAWAKLPLPLDPTTEQAPYIAAVDPTNADRVYVRSQGAPSRLFVTQDGAKTFQVIFSLANAITGFALSPDGSTVYAGSMKDGLFVGQSPGTAFQKVSSVQVNCLAARAGELWACSTETSGFAVGVSLDNGVTFAPKLHFRDILGPVACGADATAAVCSVSSASFSALCTVLNECYPTGPLTPEYDGGPPTAMSKLCRSGAGCPCQILDNCLLPDDGGEADGAAGGSDADASPTQEQAPRAGGGCSAAGGGSAAGLLASGALLALLSRRRRLPPNVHSREGA